MSILTDLTLMAKVKAQLLNDVQVPATDIKVEADNGTVTLFGSVPNMAVRQRATELVIQVEGVHNLRNFLKTGDAVKAGDPPLGGAIPKDRSQTLRDEIARLPETDPAISGKVEAFVHPNGTLVLSGSLESLKMKKQVEDAAWRQEDVKRIVNNIQTTDEAHYPDTPSFWEQIRDLLLQVDLDELPLALQPDRSEYAARVLNLLLQREKSYGAKGLGVKADRKCIIIYGQVQTKTQEEEIINLAEEVYDGAIISELEVNAVTANRSA